MPRRAQSSRASSSAPSCGRSSSVVARTTMSSCSCPLVADSTGRSSADFSAVLAGPYCTMLLGDLGADVIKVEPPDGDATRGWGPPWVGSDADGTRTAAYYLAVNRNKRSIALDLSTEPGRAVARRIIE